MSTVATHLSIANDTASARRHFRRCRTTAVCILVLIPACAFTQACAVPKTPYPEAINSERPDERILAIRHAGETGDRDVIPLLIDRLEDEDEGVRMFAILALEKLTGTRNGYVYHETDVRRHRAVLRWRGFLDDPRSEVGEPVDAAELSDGGGVR